MPEEGGDSIYTWRGRISIPYEVTFGKDRKTTRRRRSYSGGGGSSLSLSAPPIMAFTMQHMYPTQ